MAELLIAMSILMVVLGVAFSALFSAQSVVNRSDVRSQSNDQARLAVEQMDRQVRSGNILYDPAAENDAAHGIYPGLSLRIYTQTNGVQRCVQWRITGGQLQTRSWSESWQADGNVSTWRIVAENITNTSSTPAFALDSASGFGGRLLNIDVLVNVNPRVGQTVETKVSVEGRNTEYGYPVSVCSSIPSY